jgi:hypothetical protein
MTHTHFVTSALIAFTLLAAPMISFADDQPPPADADEQAIAAVRDGAVKKDDAYSLSTKRARSAVKGESTDCFYEENKAEEDCRGVKSGTR